MGDDEVRREGSRRGDEIKKGGVEGCGGQRSLK